MVVPREDFFVPPPPSPHPQHLASLSKGSHYYSFLVCLSRRFCALKAYLYSFLIQTRAHFYHLLTHSRYPVLDTVRDQRSLALYAHWWVTVRCVYQTVSGQCLVFSFSSLLVLCSMLLDTCYGPCVCTCL